MQTLYSLKNEKEVKIIRAIIEELKAENKIKLLTIRIIGQRAMGRSIKSELFCYGTQN